MRHSVRLILLSIGLACLCGGCAWLRSRGPVKSADSQPAKPAAPAPSQAPEKPEDTGLAQAGRTKPAPPAGPVIQPDIMLINGRTVTAADVLEPIWGRLEEMARTLDAAKYRARAQEELQFRLRETINEFLVWHEIQKKSNPQLAEALDRTADEAIRDRINREFNGSQARFERYLAARGLTLEDYKQQQKRRLAVMQYLREQILPRIHLSRRDLWNYHKQHKAEFETPASIDLQMIDLPVRAFLPAGRNDEPALAEARKQAYKAAQRALRELQAGADFAEVAKKYSKGIHAAEGGRWGTIRAPGLRGRWAAPSKAAFGLDEGQFSDVIETPDGYFIVRAEKKVAAQRKTFEQVQPLVEQRLREQMFQKLSRQFLMKLYMKAQVAGYETFRNHLMSLLPPPKAQAESP